MNTTIRHGAGLFAALLVTLLQNDEVPLDLAALTEALSTLGLAAYVATEKLTKLIPRTPQQESVSPPSQ